MTMEIEKKSPESNTKSQAQSQPSNNETQSDSDSGSMACPLFMEGLPRDFATNPQLAAIASLLDDDVREETASAKEEEEENEVATIVNNTHSKNAPSIQKDRTQSQSMSSRKHLSHSGKARTRCRKQRASPYPRLQDRKNDKETAKKSASVGEITLFMNMWKP